MRVVNSIVCALIGMTCAACGGGGESSNSAEGGASQGAGEPASTQPSGGTGNSVDYAFVNLVTVNGQGIFSSGSAANVSGLLNVNSGVLSLTAGSLSLTDEAIASYDGTTFTYSSGGTWLSKVYMSDNVARFEMGDGGGNTLVGYLGLATSNSHMPSGGRASYVGDGMIAIDPADGSAVQSSVAASAVAVDFGAAKLAVTLTPTATLSGGGAAFDEVGIANVAIQGSNFSGGEVIFSNQGATVDALGSGVTGSVDGNFFGWDDTLGAPDSLAGVGSASGSGGSAQFDFFAD